MSLAAKNAEEYQKKIKSSLRTTTTFLSLHSLVGYNFLSSLFRIIFPLDWVLNWIMINQQQFQLS